MATSFHGFAVKEKIGAGGMSTVYKGQHLTLGYPVAIKILHPGMGGDQSFISRFEREAKAASSLHNNNIASVIDFGSEDGIYFIVMQFVDGADVGKIFKEVVEEGGERQFPLEITLALLEEVAYGLKDAHQQGIIHRDIKPSNVLVSRKGEVKIADFGLARDTGDMGARTSMDLTMPGTVVGTPSYMSPEQAAGGEVDARTDIFSLGVMAYQLIVGEKPFKGDSPTEVQERIINEDPLPPGENNCPRITTEIDDFLNKALAKDPAGRFASMDQVIRALTTCQESIDPSGSLMKYKREYLAKFAASPVEFSGELRHIAINAHLKRGYHYKNMGLSSISDAIREFSYVLSIAPDHSKAQKAVKELKKKAEESGILPAVTTKRESRGSDTGRTQVLPQGVVSPHKDASPPPPAPSRRGLLIGLLVLLPMIVVGGIFLLRRGGGPDERVATSTPPPAGAVAENRPATTPADATTDSLPVADAQPAAPAGNEIASEEEARPTPPPTGILRVSSQPTGARIHLKRDDTPFRMVGTAPVVNRDLEPGAWEIRAELDGYVGQSRRITLREGTDREVAMVLAPVEAEDQARPPAPAEPESAAPTGPGFVKVVVSPFGNIYLDDELVASEARGAVIASAAGTRRLRISHPVIMGDIAFDELSVTSGDTIDLGRQRFRTGGLTVATSTPGDFRILVDDRQVDGPSPLPVAPVSVGDRFLSMSKDGFELTAAWLFTSSGKHELTPEAAGAYAGRYRVTVKEGQDLRIKFDLKPSP